MIESRLLFKYFNMLSGTDMVVYSKIYERIWKTCL